MTVVIVGASVAGVRTAQALRSEGYTDRIVIVDREDELPYDKPPLSKALLSGASDADSIRLITDDEIAETNLELLLGVEVTGVDLQNRSVDMADGTPLAYDDLVIATGADARRGPWAPSARIHVVRTLSDARGLRADLDRGGPVVVIGSGFVGAEVAATARGLGLEVHLVDMAMAPMGRAFTESVAHAFSTLHADRGVQLHFGSGVDEIVETDRGLVVRLTDGTQLSAATVVVGIGASPNTGWLGSSGLTLDDGVVCDEFLRAHGHEHVYAAGDVARWRSCSSGELVRAEHWTNAVDQARCVARNIVQPDSTQAYSAVEYVWTDQYDWKIQVVGHHEGAAEVRTLGDPDDGRFAVLYGDDSGELIGAAIANWPKALITARRGVAGGLDVAAAVRRLQPAVAADAGEN
ncbi:NAD(P)/FAD-dependent oxidoreductase [Gordonia phthalatica]|uniref:Ferredoxin reductase n=1 Tax=Gordonia phthalatica TaxID=1136941 RepID=A0A0N9MU62_9ACTN|nr:FAD-dependent oxidoreductase [Gordonia phthalatica]ALG86133.1 ferredoxin reductase [Gordonia phthalatica]